MSIKKISGIETEFGIVARGLDVSPMVASSLLVNAYSDDGLSLRVWDFLNETPHLDARGAWDPSAEYPHVESMMANAILPNGARYYVDHAHPEVSTPECATPSEVVRYDRAAELIITRSMERASARLAQGAELVTYKNNSDGKGNSYGCHENYLVERELPFGRLQKCITAHFVSRQVFCGAGKVGSENRREGENVPAFQLSQRADFFEEEVGLETTIRRPIVNTRDEPHADPTRFRRLHVIAGDANMSQVATWLKVGSTALVLACIEDNMFPDWLAIADPVTEMRLVSHDVSLGHAIALVDGRTITALDMQREIWSAVSDWMSRTPDDCIGGEGRTVLAEWSRVIDCLGHDPTLVADTVDWVAKQRIIEGFRERHGVAPTDPKVRAIDLQYHDMRPGKCLAARAGLRVLVDDPDAERAMTTPPVSTRAYFRGRCVATWPDRIVSANWDGIVVETTEGLVRIPMMDPTKGSQAHVQLLLDAHPSIDDLLVALAGTVERMDPDPGW